MTPHRFESLLEESTTRAIQFARKFVIEQLSDDAAYRLYPKRSNDKYPLVRDEEVYPDESLDESDGNNPHPARRIPLRGTRRAERYLI